MTIAPSVPSDDSLQALFDPAAVTADTRATNDRLMATLSAVVPPVDLADLRDAYATGRFGLPVAAKSPRATALQIPGPAGDLALRIIRPEVIRGGYLHIHGGGWTLGTNDMQDGLLEQVARDVGLVAVSVGYRLAPEHPHPAAVEDCVAAARWLASAAVSAFGTSWLAIGGESAGAHLAASTLLRLRDVGEAAAFQAANLTFGCFDLSLTPSVRRAEGTAFIDRAGVAGLAAGYCGGIDPRDPAVSPLYADLAGLPPALFTAGTIDPLVDDSLFMHRRWQAAGNRAELALYPGGVHGFNLFDSAVAKSANARIMAFLNRENHRS